MKLLCSNVGLAQHYGYPWAGNFAVAFMQYQSLQVPRTHGWCRGLELGAYHYVDETWNGSLTGIIAPAQTVYLSDTTLRGSVWDVQAAAQCKFNNGRVMSKSAIFAPFVSTGFGVNNGFDRLAVYVPLQAGASLNVSKDVRLQLQGSYRLRLMGELSTPVSAGVGFVFALPTGKERVKPRVQPQKSEDDTRVVASAANKKEASTRSVVTPLQDRDGDGVEDMYDDCPEVKGEKQQHGCPPLPKTAAAPVATAASSTPTAPTTKSSKIEIIDHNAQRQQLATPNPTDMAVAPDDIETLRQAAQQIQFQGYSLLLEESSYEYLALVAAVMRKYEDYSLRIVVHTDNSGTSEGNQVLSAQRANTIRLYLMTEFGIRTARMISEGKGSAEPIAPNDTAYGRSKNRRVELILYKPTP